MSSIRERTVLCVIDLPKKLTSRRNLQAHFSKYGAVTNVSVDKGVRSALVKFSTHFDAQAAKTHGKVYEDKSLNIFWSDGSLMDPRATEVAKRNEDFDAAEPLWEDDGKETFGVDSIQIKKSEVSRKSPENLIKQHLNPGNIKKRIGLQLKLGEGIKTKSNFTHKSPTKPGKISPKMLLSSRKNLPHANKRLIRKGGETFRSVVTKENKVLKVEDQFSKVNLPRVERTDLKMKLALLDERDKSIRIKTKMDSNIKTAVAFKGTCPDMCPERERIMRQYSLSVAAYEMIPGTTNMDENKAVKEYSRSSADQEVPLPHDLRPEPVLSMTMNYLITNIINKINSPDVNKAVWYSFCWSRLRSIRKDIILQQLCDLETVKIVEQCARFHICCYDHMWGAEVSGFDDKINTQNLIDCWQTLRHMYEDLEKHSFTCPNEPEFYSYLILLKLQSGDVMWEYQQYSLEIQLSEEVQFAIQAYMAFKNNMYSTFFSLVKKASYLKACLLQRYFNEVRSQALKTMLKAYCLPGKTVGLSASFIVQSLKFDSPTNALKFCDRDEIELKVDYDKSEDDVYNSESSFLIQEKRLPISNVVVGENNPLPVYIPHQVHSSFDEFGKLKYSLYEEESTVASGEDTSDITEDLYSEESMYLDEMESDSSVSTGSKIPSQESSFKFSLSPATKISSESLFTRSLLSNQVNQVDESFSSTSTLSPFYNKDLGPSNCFAFSTQTPTSNNSGIFKLEQSTDKNTISVFNESGKLERDSMSCSDKNKVQEQFGTQQQFLFQSVSSSKLDNSYQEYRSPCLSVTTAMDVGSVFSFGSTADNKKPQHSHINVFGNQSEVNSFISDSMGIKFHDFKNRFDSNYDSVETSSVQEPVSAQIILHKDSTAVKEDRKIDSSYDPDKAKRKAFLDKLLKEKLEEEKRLMEQIKRQAEEKQRKEIEEKRILQNLKKDVSERMKAHNARNFARLWRKKIAKLKQTRADLPYLVQLSVKDHLSKWGTINYVSNCKISQRAKDKKNLSTVTSQMLISGITDSCKYIGKYLAEILAKSATNKMKTGSVKPVFWKLVVSVPWLSTASLQLDVFNQLMRRWFTESFYNTPDSHLGSVESILTSVGIPVNMSVHFSENLETSQSIQAMNALVFVVVNEAEPEKLCLQRLRSLLLCQDSSEECSVVVMNVGGVKFERVLKIELEKLHKQNVIAHWSINSWSNPTSIYESLTFLAEHISITSDISACPLEVLVEHICEDFFDALSSGQHFSSSLMEALKNPNHLIHLYNTCLTKLENLLLSRKLEKYFNFPEEFKACVSLNESGGPELLCGKQYDDMYKSEVSKKMNFFKLNEFKNWPPTSFTHLVDTLKAICREVHDIDIFPQIIRRLDIPDDVNLVDYLKEISWLNIVEVLAQCSIRHSFVKKDQSERFYVLFDKNDIQRLIQNQWWLKPNV